MKTDAEIVRIARLVLACDAGAVSEDELQRALDTMKGDAGDFMAMWVAVKMLGAGGTTSRPTIPRTPGGRGPSPRRSAARWRAPRRATVVSTSSSRRRDFSDRQMGARGRPASQLGL